MSVVLLADRRMFMVDVYIASRHPPASLHTIKAHGNLLGRNNLHSDGLLIAVQDQLLHARPSVPRILVLVVVFAVVLAVALPALAVEDGIEFASCGGGFGACFFFRLSVGVESRE